MVKKQFYFNLNFEKKIKLIYINIENAQQEIKTCNSTFRQYQKTRVEKKKKKKREKNKLFKSIDKSYTLLQ